MKETSTGEYADRNASMLISLKNGVLCEKAINININVVFWLYKNIKDITKQLNVFNQNIEVKDDDLTEYVALEELRKKNGYFGVKCRMLRG